MKNGEVKFELKESMTLWKDKKRYLGMPISFTKYTLNEDKLMINKGFLNLTEEEILLYRIRDMKLEEKFFDRLFKTGNLYLFTTDVSMPELKLIRIKNPKKIKEIIGKCVEISRQKNGVRSTELMSGATDASGALQDTDGDGIADAFENAFETHDLQG